MMLHVYYMYICEVLIVIVFKIMRYGVRLCCGAAESWDLVAIAKWHTELGAEVFMEDHQDNE